MSNASLSPLRLLSSLGQSVWIDFLSRESIRGGHLHSLLEEDSVVGATSRWLGSTPIAHYPFGGTIFR